jgi:hypothetical protein
MWSRVSLSITTVLVAATAAPPTRPLTTRVEDTIQLVGRMRVARAAATATTLPGDRVLIAGGMVEGGGALREFEIFDALTNRVVATGEMAEARASHTATKLSDGRVLILGGYNGGYLKTAEIFDPRTRQFTSAGSMTVGRSGHTATLLENGAVLITGGVGDGWSFLASAEVFDPHTVTFTALKSMSVARESHTATLLRDGRVLIAGGHRDRRENIVVYGSTEIYDPVQERFIPGPMLSTARHKHDAIGLADGRVLVIGGSDPRDRTRYSSAEVYDPLANTWSSVAAMRIGRYKFRDTAIRLRDGRVLIAGSGRFAEVFDPRANAFTRVEGDLGRDYSFASAVLLDDGRALVLGGYDDSMHNSDGIWRFRE